VIPFTGLTVTAIGIVFALVGFPRFEKTHWLVVATLGVFTMFVGGILTFVHIVSYALSGNFPA
jgi:hypothetical protein